MWNECCGMNYGGFNFFSGIVSLFWWVFMVFLVVCLLVYAKKFFTSHYSDGNMNALDILNERYAKGEMNKADFEEKRRDLEEVLRQQNRM